MSYHADILSHWHDDLVAFVLGCSFSFEWPLIEDGIELRHITKGINVAMYRTNIDTQPCMGRRFTSALAHDRSGSSAAE